MNDDYVAPGTGKTLSTSSLIACGAFAGLLLLYVCTHACTGFAVDIVLYPIDTVKTRLQSERGFKNSGGFRRIYAGVPSILVGSAPSAALFFTAYETIKHVAGDTPPAHMLAAMMGEVAACFVRVPTEVVKQRSQASPNLPTSAVLHRLFIADGVGGLYRGFGSTILREIPFSVIEFPLWEAFKRRTSQYTGKPLTSIQSAACGALAGTVAAALTTPLDVAKTRIMLNERVYGTHRGALEPMTVRQVLVDIWRVHGVRGIYAGVLPRSVWMGVGGFVFFGAFECARAWMSQPLRTTAPSSNTGWRAHYAARHATLESVELYAHCVSVVLSVIAHLRGIEAPPPRDVSFNARLHERAQNPNQAAADENDRDQ